MVDSIGGSQNPYWNQYPNRIPSSAANESDSNKGAGGPIGYILNGDPDKRPPTAKAENQQGPVHGFLEGMKNGLVGTVKGLFSVNGLLMMGGTLALIAATGGAATPFLVAAGVGAGAFQMGHGLLRGDWEEMGRGAFMAGSTFLGAKFDFAKGASKATAKTSQAVSNASDSLSNASRIASNRSKGEDFAMALNGKFEDMPTMTDHLKLLAGKEMTGSKGSKQSVYGVILDNGKHWVSQAGDMFQKGLGKA
jgi:hypothetical protein